MDKNAKLLVISIILSFLLGILFGISIIVT